MEWLESGRGSGRTSRLLLDAITHGPRAGRSIVIVACHEDDARALVHALVGLAESQGLAVVYSGGRKCMIAGATVTGVSIGATKELRAVAPGALWALDHSVGDRLAERTVRMARARQTQTRQTEGLAPPKRGRLTCDGSTLREDGRMIRDTFGMIGRHTLSGAEGVVDGYGEWATGCKQLRLCLAPEKPSLEPTYAWFDIDQVALRPREPAPLMDGEEQALDVLGARPLAGMCQQAAETPVGGPQGLMPTGM